MKRGEVWWVEFDPSVGSEIRKTRSAVIVSNDAANRNLARVVVAPLTSNTGRQYPGEAVVSVNGQSSKAMADQIMAADKARLKSQLGTVGKAALKHFIENPEIELVGVFVTSPAKVGQDAGALVHYRESLEALLEVINKARAGFGDSAETYSRFAQMWPVHS